MTGLEQLIKLLPAQGENQVLYLIEKFALSWCLKCSSEPGDTKIEELGFHWVSGTDHMRILAHSVWHAESKNDSGD